MKLADNIIQNILGKKKKIKDWDGDGVSDDKDCQPRNTMRQDNLSQMGYARLRQMGDKLSVKQTPAQQVVMSKEGEAFVLKKDIKSKIY